MPNNGNLYRRQPTDPIDVIFVNQVLADIQARFTKLESFAPDWEEAVNRLNSIGVSNFFEYVQPLIEQVSEAAKLGFLMITSSTSLTLTEGEQFVFVADEGSQRATFRPSSFVGIARSGGYEFSAIGEVISYDSETGELLVTIRHIVGSGGPYSDWEITSESAVIRAVIDIWDDVSSALVTVTDAAEELSGAAGAAASSAATAVSARNDALAYRNNASTSASAAVIAADAAALSAETAQAAATRRSFWIASTL
ncbi:hypothetical protein L1787_16480 [Acuticoccus sp. M5D2P5]|uniref:hypothetical protein n=1 Tax=Acuticoccus kalidii TaxID=2910977 RepID=UPI001F2CF18C|nr:hypothetical protein [Acuticoccus kalidii]MCF3935002.1 hypothetical protein [Acuticoccus kalidii]